MNQEIPGVVSEDRFPAWSMGIALALPLLGIMAPDFYVHFFVDKIRKPDLEALDVVFFLVGFPLLFFLIVALLVAACRRKLRGFLSYLVALSVLATSIFGFNAIVEKLQIIKVWIFPYQ